MFRAVLVTHSTYAATVAHAPHAASVVHTATVAHMCNSCTLAHAAASVATFALLAATAVSPARACVSHTFTCANIIKEAGGSWNLTLTQR